MTLLITGSNGLVGSVTARFFLEAGHTVVGIDNNMRQLFFGKQGSTTKIKLALSKFEKYSQYDIDIRDAAKLKHLFTSHTFDAIIHTAAQPSHDKAKDIPILDFEVNALGTLHLLQLTKAYFPKASFIFTSTNKVYGDTPNTVPLVKRKKKYWFKDKKFLGFNESVSIDNSLHSLFGCSKLAADMYVQEYGRYFGLKTTTLRLGCITGGDHAGVKLHGFLSFLIKSLLTAGEYTIIGYDGKQVRDQIHANDVATAFAEIIKNPTQGEVFNLGGGIQNAASILEIIDMVGRKTNRTFTIKYEHFPRIGDHICYVTDYSKFSNHYPNWAISRSLDEIIDEHLAHHRSP